MAGPYKILERVGNAYRIDLPPLIKVHPIIPPNWLRKAGTNPLPGQHNNPLPPIKVDRETEYEVKQLLAVWVYQKKLQYRAKWVGYEDDPTWYDAEAFQHSPYLIHNLHCAYPNLPPPSTKLDQWLRECKQRADDYGA